MRSWVLVFVSLAVIAALVGFFFASGLIANIAKIAFFIALVLVLVALIVYAMKDNKSE